MATEGKINILMLAPCLLAILVDGMGFGLVYPIMTSIFTSQQSNLSAGMSITQLHFYLGLGYMLYPFCMFFGASFMGDLSDNIGRKKVILLCMFSIFISFLSMALGAVLTSIFLLMLGRALSGLMAGSQPIAQAAISDLSTPETKPLNMSIMTLALSVAIVVGPLIGGIFSDTALSPYFTFATPFFIAAALAGIATIWIFFGFQETYISKKPHKIDIWRPLKIFVEAFKHPMVSKLACVFLLMQIGFSIYFQFILVLLHNNYHYTNWQLGVFNGFIGLSFAVSLLIGMRVLLHFFTVNKIAVLSLFIVGICVAISAYTPSELALWILAFPLSAFDMIAYTALLTAFSDVVDKSAQGWVMGISGAIMALSWAATGLTANAIPFLGVAGLILLGGVFLIMSGALMWITVRKLPMSCKPTE